ncbi:MAG TPA: MFS transporter [Solirubrobacteraceae bacterium]|nr:MFS transporter [Solirubrobacteraceae bacterium]
MSAQHDGHAQHAIAAADPRRWWALGAVCVATFMLLLDITVVNVALPDISKDLGAGFGDLQWVIDAYALSLASFTLTMGSLADRYGRRLVFTGGLVVFTLASALCGLATSSLFLILARGLQGVGGAAMFATSLALLAANFSGRERGTAFGLWGATTGGAVAIGPLVGGILVTAVSWQSIFYVNIPVGIAAVAVALTRVPESRNPAAGRVDIPGLVTLVVGLSSLVFALVRGNTEGWSSTVIVTALAVAAVMLVAFVLIELRAREPMLDLRLFRIPSFTGAQVAAFGLSSSMFAMFLYLTLYIQNGLGFSPLEAGVRFLAITLLSFIAAPISGRLSARVPTRWLIGGGLTLVGLGLLAMRGLTADSTWTALLLGFAVAGLGIGLTNPPLASTAVGVVPPWRAGVASGINSTFRQVGIATGTAALGAIFAGRLTPKLDAAFAQAGPAVQRVAAHVPDTVFQSGGSGPFPRGSAGQQAALTAFTGALNDILLVGGVTALVSAALVVVLIHPRDFVPAGAPEAQDAPASVAGTAEPARP